MNRRRFLKLAAASSLVPAALSAAPSGKRPNILFIFTDDHCEQALSAYDPARMTTPNMDRRAQDGDGATGEKTRKGGQRVGIRVG